jgi:quinoprotein relay system zinc metallohydrolase 2
MARAPAFRAAILLAASAGLAHGDDVARVTEIAPGLYVRAGHHGVVFEANDVANIGFVVGERCVAVIDSGGSEAEASALLRAIREVTTLPVCYVIDTHAHPDHLLGNRVFARAGARVVGHARLARSLAPRAPTYLARAAGPGAAPLPPEVLVVPEITVTDTLALDLGERSLELTAHETAHTDNDLTVYDVATRTLWLGDLVFVDHVPVLDGSLLGWLEVLNQLGARPADRAVPGHGPPGIAWPAGAADTRRYLGVLRDELRARIAAGDDLRKAQDDAGYTERSRWQLFESYHRRNVATAYAELEWE